MNDIDDDDDGNDDDDDDDDDYNNDIRTNDRLFHDYACVTILR